MITTPEITCYRFIIFPLKGGGGELYFYNKENKCNSHSGLFMVMHNPEMDFERAMELTTTKRQMPFGAFYTLYGGNSAEKVLLVYGSSLDFPVSEFTEEGLKFYRGVLEKYCEEYGYRLVWNIGK